ncbi:hypothetical protein [Pseudomonas poae]|uniref:hypothetical protein n=1 Tax=Pseudomonas poae TaxID=200451 RepID=UPI0011B0EA91|nr:hypothetical protein [Pseudomonas poae]
MRENSDGLSGWSFQLQKKHNPRLAGVDALSRGKLKCVGIYLFFLIINLLANLLGIPVGTLCGLDSMEVLFEHFLCGSKQIGSSGIQSTPERG